MRVAVVLQKPTRTSKTRLKDWLSVEERACLVQAMLTDVLSQLSQVRSLDYFGVITRDPDAIRITQAFGGHVFFEKEVNGMNHGIRAVKELLGTRVKQMVILPADIPLISAQEVDALIRRSAYFSVTIIPCRRMTGTNGLILSPPHVMDTAFGQNSMKKHCMMACDLGLDYTVSQVPSLSNDIDTIEDLRFINQIGYGTLTRQYITQSHIIQNSMDIEVTL